MKKDETEKMVKSDSTIITNCAEIRDNGITRKEALQKAGKYAAFTAAAAVLLLSPKKSYATSGNPVDPGSGGGSWGSGSGGGVPGAPGGGSNSGSPFSRPEPTSSSSGLRDSPWK